MSYAKIRQSLAEGLETAYKIPEDDIATILPEDESEFSSETFLSKFLEYDKDRVEIIGQKGKDKFEQGYSKGKKESLTKQEEQIREEFNIDDNDLVGIDLVKKVVEINSKKSKGDVSKLSDDELKSHPSVINLLTERENRFKTEKEQLIEEHQSKLKEFSRKETMGKVSNKALDILDSLNPVLSEDPVRAKNQRNFLLRELDSLDFQINDSGNIIPLKDGKILEDQHGHSVNFEDFVSNKAKALYDFKQAPERGTPPSGGGNGSGGGSQKFKSEAEYAKYMSDRSISLEDRKKAQESWNKQAAS